jgi:glycosyltransferase involved in cell wall biosynthesis
MSLDYLSQQHQTETKESDMASNPYKVRIAYMMSRFPVLTETFIMYEIQALEHIDVRVEIYPLLREQSDVMHDEARTYAERAHYAPFISLAILRANLHFILRRPRRYFGALWSLLKGTWGSRRYFTGAIGIFPKSVLFAQLMDAENVSHIHAHFASHPTAAAFVISRLVGIPYSFTAHGSDIHRDQTMLAEKVAEALFVLPISSYNRDVILRACNGRYSDKLLTVHCGVDTDLFTPNSRNGDRPARDKFTIACIGTLHEVKGQVYLIEACRLLKDQGVDLNCIFVGDGPDRTDLQHLVDELNLDDIVHFKGRRTRAEILRLLEEVDVLVTPSVPSRDGRREGIPVVLMEGMACGLPVVASRLSGIPELVDNGQSGLLVSPRDVSGLAEAIRELHDNENLRQRLGEAGRAKVEKEFCLEKNTAKRADLFISISRVGGRESAANIKEVSI